MSHSLEFSSSSPVASEFQLLVSVKTPSSSSQMRKNFPGSPHVIFL